VPMPPSQVLYEAVGNRTQTSVIRDCRLTAWTITRRLKCGK